MKYIDSVKGIGILLVVLGHHLQGQALFCGWINSFHMPLFFIVSGYLFAYKNDFGKSFGTIVLSKAKSLLYPYIVLSFVVLIWNWIFYNLIINATPESTSVKILCLTLTSFGYHALWFLPCLFCASILFLQIIKTRFHAIIFISITIFALLVYIMFGDFLKIEIPYLYKYIFRVSISISFIYLGYLFYKLISCISKFYEYLILVLTFIISVTFVILKVLFSEVFPDCNLAVGNIGNPYIYHLNALANSLCIILMCKNIRFPQKLLSFFGKNSIIIMALHMDLTVDIAWIIVSVLDLPIGITLNSLLVIIIEMVALSVMAIVINKWLSFLIKFPSRKYKRKTN